MKNCISFVILLCSMFFAEGQNLTVNYKFTKGEEINKFFNLEITNDKSIFYDSNFCNPEVLLKSEFMIFKDKSHNFQIFDMVDNIKILTDLWVVNEWKLINEKKIISGLVAMKAETVYKKKVIVAWYTGDLPIQKGPFIFEGLPGLILEIDSDDFKFELVGMKEINNNCTHFSDLERKEIPYKKYVNLFYDIDKRNANLFESIMNLNLDLKTENNPTKNQDILRTILLN